MNGDKILMPGDSLEDPQRHPISMPGEGLQVAPADLRSMQQILKEGYKLTPATMANKITRGAWIPARHLQYISTIVATEIAKGDARIIVTMPARHGKSEFLSVHTSMWFLEKWPSKYVMNISYGSELVEDFSFKVRTMFLDEENHHLLSTRLNTKKLKVNRFLTTAGGGVTAAGVGGTITGRGADLLLIDDYIKNAEEAMSATTNKSIWEWYKTTANTRLEPGASIVILATRWSQNDLIEKCMTEMAHENWIVIRLPALAEANDPLGRKVGEALWPERYNRKRLLSIKKGIGDYWWQAMYQQRPKASMAGADLGDKLRVIPESEAPPRHELTLVRTWDLASTENAGDYTAGPLCGFDPSTGRMYIMDMDRFQKSPRKLEERVRLHAEADGAGIAIWIEQEPGSAGVIVIAHFQSEVLAGWSVQGEKATGKIEVRASPFLADLEAGLVYAIDGPWVRDLKAELNGFPDADHDDQITGLALAHLKLNASKYGRVIWGRFPKGKKLKLLPRSHDVAEGTRSTRSVVWGRRT